MSTQIDTISPERLKEIREASGLSQVRFWGAIGVKQSAGSDYEKGQRMPEPVRRLLVMHYVAGIPTDATTGHLERIGALAQSESGYRQALASARSNITDAGHMLDRALRAIKGEP